MHKWLLQTIRALEQRLQTNPSVIVRLGVALQLLTLYIIVATFHAVATLFLSPQDSFRHCSQLIQGVGYTGSYIEHRQWKHNLRFGTLSYSLVLACSVMTIITLFSVVNNGEFTPPVLAATKTVNSDNDIDNGVCNVGHCSLREALHYAHNGDTIAFNGDRHITLTSGLTFTQNSLTIDGVSNAITVDCANVANTAFVVNGNGANLANLTVTNCNRDAIHINEEDAIVDNVTITGSPASSAYGVMEIGSGTTVKNSTVECANSSMGVNVGIGDADVQITDNEISGCDSAVSQSGGDSITISRNTFTTTAGYAIAVTAGSGGTYSQNVFGSASNEVHGAISIGQNSTDNLIDNNIINYSTGSDAAILLNQSQLSGINNIVSNNTIINAERAIKINHSSNNRLFGNAITNSSVTAIWLFGTSGEFVDGNVIGQAGDGTGTGNTITSSPNVVDVDYGSNTEVRGNTITGSTPSGTDILLSNSTSATIANNTLSGSGVPNPGKNPSIKLDATTGSTISGNTITLPAYPIDDGSQIQGIYLINASNGNTISDNTITETTSGGVGIWIETDNNVISSNTVTGHGVAGVKISGGNVNHLSDNTIYGSLIAGIILAGTSNGNILGLDLNGDGAANTIGPISNTEITSDGSGVTNTIIRGNNYVDNDDGDIVNVSNGATQPTAPELLTHTPTTITGTTTSQALVDFYYHSDSNITYIGSTTADTTGAFTKTSDLFASGTEIYLDTTTSDGTSSSVINTQPTQVITMTNPIVTVTDTTALITWTTNITADSMLDYGIADITEAQLEQPHDAVTEHSISVTDLIPNTTYVFRVTTEDSVTHYNFISTDGTFTTTAPDTTEPDTAAPVISAITIAAINYNSTTITWITDEAASEIVVFGTTNQYGTTQTDSNLATSHTVTFDQLDPSTTYHYRIIATDASDNTDSTGDRTVTTQSLGEAVVTHFTITSLDGTQTIVPKTTDDVSVELGDLTFQFTDTTATLQDYRVHFVLKQLEQNKALQQALVNRKEAINQQGVAEVKVKANKLEVKKRYAVYTGLLGKTGGSYVNETGLHQRFTFKVTAGPPTIISPATTIMNGMISDLAATTEDNSVSFAVRNASGELKNSCTGQAINGLAQCTLPFSLPLGEYTLTATSDSGATRTQAFFVSRLADGAFTTDTRAHNYLYRLTYSARPTFSGLSIVGHTVTVNGVAATLKSGGNGAVTSWKATLTSALSAGNVTNITIIDRAPDGTNTTLLYPVYRPFQPVTPHIFSPATGEKFLFGDPILVTVGAPDDHYIEVFNADNNTLLFTSYYVDQTLTFDASTFFSKPGTHHLSLRNKNSLGLTSQTVNLSFTTYQTPAVVVPPVTTPIVTEPTDNTSTDTTNPSDTNNDSSSDTTNGTVVDGLNPIDLNGNTNNNNTIKDSNNTDNLQGQDATIVNTYVAKLQEIANNVDTGNTARQPIDYPLITLEQTSLTDAERQALQINLTEDIRSTTKFDILPGASTKVLNGEAKVVSVDREIGINDIVNWMRQSPNKNVTSSLQGTYVVLSGQATNKTGQPQFVLITLFSTPVVRIAKVDNSGRWTMTIPAELLSIGQHSVYVASETNGTRSDQVEVARFVIQQNNHLSKTTWLVIINVAIALLALIISIVLQLRKRHLMSQVTNV